jgi:hypothetical protein
MQSLIGNMVFGGVPKKLGTKLFITANIRTFDPGNGL